MPRPLNVAIVVPELPYPPTSGFRICALNLAIRLAARHHITLIAHSGPDAEEASRFLKRKGVEVALADRMISRKSGPLFYLRVVANLFAREPYSAATLCSRELRGTIRSFASTNPVDIWQIESTFLHDALADVHGAPKVGIAHNLESLIWRRYVEVENNPFSRSYKALQLRKVERFERRAFAGQSTVVAVSEQDAPGERRIWWSPCGSGG